MVANRLRIERAKIKKLTYVSDLTNSLLDTNAQMISELSVTLAKNMMRKSMEMELSLRQSSKV